MKAAVDQKQIRLLSELMELPFMKNYYLAGGTNLALRYNHRKSIDLDLFIHQKLDIEGSNYINLQLKEHFKERFESVQVTSVGVFGFIDGVKTDFVNYPYALLQKVERKNNWNLASVLDIGAMKINAIVGRGTKKDFYDLFELLKKYTLKELLNAYQKKYKIDNIQFVKKSLTYFGDAENPEMRNNYVESLQKTSWKTIKNTLINHIKKTFQRGRKL